MYNYVWDEETGGYLLDTKISGVTKELRPVFHEELDLLGFRDFGWEYEPSDKPLLWAETRRYIHNGELVAEANGGGLYTKPTLKIHKTPLVLEPVNIDEMAKRNNAKMSALIQHTAGLIFDKYSLYKDKVDVVYVAFSGGKDSIVLLDLVQKSLPHDVFKVVFGDTTMEVSDTYKAVKTAKEKYPSVDIYTATSKFDAMDSWELFGTPSRTLRWCCAVHKSAPSLLKLREIIGKTQMSALAFDGVRSSESLKRATYIANGDNSKHGSQSNAHPLASWNAAEVFLYILGNDLMYNNSYRYGNIRVGCIICPFASDWGEYITNRVYPNETNKFLKMISKGLIDKISDDSERTKYIGYGGWKVRIDGRDFSSEGNRVIESENNETYIYNINGSKDTFLEWLKPIGNSIRSDNGSYLMSYKKDKYIFDLDDFNNGFRVTINKRQKTQDFVRFMYLFKNAMYKTAYCEQCRVCEVECRFGALSFPDNRININSNCAGCEKCLDMPKGCLIAKSRLYITGGKNVMITGLGNYLHFGFDKTWLDYYFELEYSLWSTDKLGKPKYDALKLFLRESEITENNSITQKGIELKRMKTESTNCWAIILCNLTYNSSLFRWYVFNAILGLSYTQNDLIELLGDKYAASTKSNAVTTLARTFKSSPIGNEQNVNVENTKGSYIIKGLISICQMKGKTVSSMTHTSWENPEPLVILYALYKFAEKCDGHYGFTLSYLCDDTMEREGISPTKIFGLSEKTMREILIGLSRDYTDYIGVEFQKDLDNIDLKRDKTSLDVLKLINS